MVTFDYAGAEAADIGPSEQSLALYVWQEGGWTESGIQIVERDTGQHRLVVTVDHTGTFALFRRGFVFLPLVANNYVNASDLVVESLTSRPGKQMARPEMSNWLSKTWEPAR